MRTRDPDLFPFLTLLDEVAHIVAHIIVTVTVGLNRLGDCYTLKIQTFDRLATTQKFHPIVTGLFPALGFRLRPPPLTRWGLLHIGLQFGGRGLSSDKADCNDFTHAQDEAAA